ncbi:BTAD domain-containing putative transcriptional regulator [Acrocarpospora macrocephala]|uniref:nSTAND1 domain-containing NTPase n=1 Tax=Acrocarpospora macrocephala TaxID=150177 RepID=UPI0012D34DFD|nr:BTAD domain-containing putative transcriptional regulator [Acrocarpospora macrocephala]
MLGPLAVEIDGAALPLRSTKQRILLGVLVSQANTPVPRARLAEALWERPPASAAENLRLYVHQLRRTLWDGERITRDTYGYSIRVGPGELDADRFDRDVAAAALAEDPAAARDLLDRALALWRGPAYGDLAETPVIRQAALKLEESRLRAGEDRVLADLKLGRHADVVAELTAMTETFPFRESIRGHLMVALYRSGRQAEALEVFRRTRALLADQLGVEPGLELRRLHEAVLRGDRRLAAPQRSRQVAVTAGTQPPFQGMRAFGPEQEEWFFGRAQAAERLLDRVGRLPIVSVLGASGSGKSSLLRAGLLGPASRDPRWQTLLMTPGDRPLEALARQVAKLADLDADRLREDLARDPSQLDIALRNAMAPGPPETRVLLVVDQFEEVFTLCADPAERDLFIRALLDAALGPDRRTTVVQGVRADFLAQLSRHADLVAALADEATLLIGPPALADLREMITGPAARAGLTVDAELLATIVAETGTAPGSLPLLSHALLETWRNRTGTALSLAAYQAGGGVRGAIAQTAEREYDLLDDTGRRIARRIFLRLTALGEGTDDTRRPVDRAELDGIADPEAVDGVLDALAAARLIVLAADRVEVAHEALIRAWPRLHRWLTDDRADLLAHRRLTEDARTWAELGRDPGVLYRGLRLLTAGSWAEENPQELNQREAAFLAAGRALADTERLASARRTRLFKRLAAGLAVMLVLAIAGAVTAVRQGGEARLRQLVESSHQLALTSRQLLATDPDTAGLLAVEAHRLRPDPQTLGAMLSAAAVARRRIDLNTGGTPVFDIALSPDGKLAASAGRDGTIGLWDPARRTLLASLTGHADGVDHYARDVAFSADSTLLASVASAAAIGPSAGSLIVWDVRARRALFKQAYDRLSGALAFSSDGTTVAVGTDTGIEVRDIGGQHRRTLTTGHEVLSLAFSPDRRLLVSADGKGEPIVWGAATGERVTTVPAPGAHTVDFDAGTGRLATSTTDGGVHFWDVGASKVKALGDIPAQEALAWVVSAPANGRIAVANEYGYITIWDVARRLPLATYQDRGRAEARSVALSRDGAALASAGLGRTIVIREHAVPPFIGHSGAVNDIETSSDGLLTASAGSDGTVRLWDQDGTPLAVLADHSDHVQAIAFSPGGERLLALTRDHTIVVWDVALRRRIATVPYAGLAASTDIAHHPDGRSVATASQGRFRWDTPAMSERPIPGLPYIATTLEYSRDGRLLVSGSPAGSVLVWDTATDTRLLDWATGQGEVRDVSLSPDGKLAATAGADRTVKIWNVRSGTAVATLTGHTASVQVVAFSRNGRFLAAAGDDHTISVWDTATWTRVAVLTGHDAPVRALAFTSGGDLLSGGDDGKVIRWSLSADAARARICREVGRDLPYAEWSTYLPVEPYHATCG